RTACAHDSEQRHRLWHALQFMAAALLDDEETRDLPLYPCRHKDRTRLGQTLGSRCDVRHIAEYLASGVDDHRPQVDGDARRDGGPAAALFLPVHLCQGG